MRVALTDLATIQSDPAIWWYVTRASAIIAWVLLVLSVMLGILLSTRVLKPHDNPGWLLDLHRWASGLSVVFVGLHMFSLWADDYAHFSVPDLFVPMHSTYTLVKQLGPYPVALGVVCFYFMVAVQFTSLLMRVLPRRLWKGIHYLSYATVLLVSFHAGWTGTDTRAWLYRVTAIGLIMLTTVALVVRILLPKSARTLSAVVEQRRPNKRSGETQMLRVRNLTHPADGVLGIELAPVAGGQLASWLPGSHITLHLPDGMKRQYSLCGDPAERESFQIAVLRAAESRGGSRWLHEQLAVGDTLEVSGPHNHFELEPSGRYIFVAGGIGITPIKSMIESLPARRDWSLLYTGRSRTSMAFAAELALAYPDRVTIHANDEAGGPPDLAAFLAGRDGEVYVCGPERLLEAITALVPSDRLHFERFSAVAREGDPPAHSVEVTMSRSRRTFTVEPGQSILDGINRHGGAVISSCGEGVCGTCEIRVLSGEPWHLDSAASDEDKDELSVMYPCVSWARGATLTVDV